MRKAKAAKEETTADAATAESRPGKKSKSAPAFVDLASATPNAAADKKAATDKKEQTDERKESGKRLLNPSRSL